MTSGKFAVNIPHCSKAWLHGIFQGEEGQKAGPREGVRETLCALDWGIGMRGKKQPAGAAEALQSDPSHSSMAPCTGTDCKDTGPVLWPQKSSRSLIWFQKGFSNSSNFLSGREMAL